MPVSNTRSLVILVFVLAPHFIDVTANHHHIKLRHGRHRRQHGESYLPASFVSDTDEEETGTWGPWSAPSSCSRSCGGGVAYQSRTCHDTDDPSRDDSCTGSRKRFFSCNVQECPEPATDFRAEQCSEYNNISVDGAFYEWVPYTGGPNKCELNCMPRRERFFYRHKLSVTDGTPCTNEQNDVCVQGKCRPVGCDMMLGSDAKEDRCRECGGDGSACNTISGLLDTKELQVGYNDLLLIPAGATNIAISEVRPSNNYLAIRNVSGHYYLNGNWRIDFPRSLKFAGSVFHYERRPKEFLAADIINALGPTSEALYIVLLYQDTNVGVNYEYSIPKRFSPQSSPDSYTWVAEEFSDCSSTCGGGIQSRLVRCVKRGDNSEADPNLCDQQLEPAGTQSCGSEPCPPTWVVLDWGPCSKRCGAGGEQSRQIKCEQIISGGIPSIVDDYRCLELIGPKDIEIQECNKHIECPHWHSGPWKPCDRLCGKGKQTRQITCFSKVNGKISVKPDKECEEERPESEKDCELRPCAGVDWVVSQWSGCENNCGLTQETRTTLCMTLAGEVYPDEQCNAETKPQLSRECQDQERCSFQWYTTQWSECSAKCGTGIQTRKVFCGTSPIDSETIKKVGDDRCDPAKRYNDTKDCVAEVKECKGKWFAGPWGECSKECGGGETTRKLICMKDNKVVPPQDNCYPEDIPFASESCNVKPCLDETIPVPGKATPPPDEEEECEDYQDDEFVSVNSDLDIVDTSAFDYPFGMKFYGRYLDDMMMGDGIILDDKNDEGSGASDGDDTLFSDLSSEGSGWESTSYSSTYETDYTESTETTDTYETSTTDSTESTPTPSPTSAQTQTTAKHVKQTFPDVDIEQSKVRKLVTENVERSDNNYDDNDDDDGNVTPSTSTGDTSGTSPGSQGTGSELDTTPSTFEGSTSTGSDSTSDVTTASSNSEPSESSGTDTTVSSSMDTSVSSGSDATGSSSSDMPTPSGTATTESSGTDTTLAGSTLSSSEGASTESTSESALSSSSKTTSGSDATTLSNSEATGLSSSDTTISTSAETSGSSSSDLTTASSLGATDESSSDSPTLSSSDSTTLSSVGETGSSSSSDTTPSSSSETTGSSGSDSTTLSSVGETGSTSSDTSPSSSSETTGSSGSDSTTLSSLAETGSTSSDTSPSSSSETTGSSGSDSTTLSSVGETGSSSSETSPSSSSETTGSSGSDSTTLSSVGETGSTSSDTSPSSSSETTGSSGSDSTILSSLEETGSTSSDTSPSSSSETTGSSGSDSTTLSSLAETGSTSSDTSPSSSSETTGSSGSDSTTLSSVGETGSSSSETSPSSSSETTGSSGSDSTTLSSVGETESSSSSTSPSSSSVTTSSSGSESTTLSSLASTETTSSGSTSSSSSETTGLSSSDATGSTETSTSESTVSSSPTSEITESSSSDTTIVSSSEATGSSSSETTISSSSTEVTGSSSSETTASSSSETTESSSSETSPSSSSDTTISSSSESTGSTSSDTSSSSTESTVSGGSSTTEAGLDVTSASSSDTSASSSSETTESSSESTLESSTETTELPTTDTTISSSSEATGSSSSSSETTEISSSQTTESSSSSETTVSGSSSVSSETTESSTGTDTEGTGSTETSESESTITFGGSDITTDSGSTDETTESGITETDEEISSTDQSHITDIFTSTMNPVDKVISVETRFKCKPRKRKSCKTSKFGCCYDGVKAATGPFGKGCPIPKTCKETEFGCCPDEVSPATGPDNQGCPESHCSETLFGCCPDNATPAEGNDNEGCPIPCDKSEFGCCPDGKTSASGKDNLGCCNSAKHGCCPDGIKPASGPDGQGCAEETTSTAAATGVEPETTTASDTTEVETSTSESDATSTSSETDATTTSEVESTTVEVGCAGSEFGCCPDGVTPVRGPNYYGCEMDCENTAFGCCHDGSTPAHGPNGEGCCLSSPYGCCPDNIQRAQGPDLYGCGCQYSRYGCCPDNNTTALGPDNLGCPCEYTPHGCCPNQIAPASGPGYEGCPCHTHQFGCCPDGVTVAIGPHEWGCGCENTEFKCCPDGVTPAKGENYAGCTCDASKFGCCQDGIEEAQGENFEGCLTVPTKSQQACGLDRDRGSCVDFTVRWFFDTNYGGCSRFWYGGCEGNGNRFKTQEECKDVCVQPKGRDACYLPKSTGPCNDYDRKWYYDVERKQCGEFIYTGCLGNANRFKTREDCEELCVLPDELDACEQPKEVGPCEGNFTRWYYDKDSSSCEEFSYGGCKANKNNFRTQKSCEQKCLTPGQSRVRDVCALEREPGPCPGSSLRWYYDSKRKSCRQFVYGGCKGNGNKFRTYAACEQRCPVRDSCTLPRAEGSCTEKLARWNFDQSENRCMPFYYTGCGGNRNNYESRDACDSDCPPKIEQNICLLPALLGECHNYTRRWYYDVNDQRCRQFYWGGCGGNGNNFENEHDCTHRCEPKPVTVTPPVTDFPTQFCFLPDETGPCDSHLTKFFYDSRDGICRPFDYGGCGGNGNKFDTIEECENRCGNVQDLCSLPPVTGPCRAYFRNYYYDRNTDSCSEFVYGGCEGNKNNFENKGACEQRCKKSFEDTTAAVQTTTPVTTTTTTKTTVTTTIATTTTETARHPYPKSPSCSAPMEPGPCTENITAYYYDISRGICQAFLYGGCGGNANRFGTEEQCERLCGTFQPQDLCNIVADPGPCDGEFPKYYYDPSTRGCHQFVYGGCEGNANRFSSKDECESVCIYREEPKVPGNTTTVSSLEICNEPVSIGSCSVGQYKRYYYDDERQNCLAFIYTGCGGNLNRFKTYGSCIETCMPSNEIDVGPPQPGPEDPCLAAKIRCSQLRCQYGKEEFVDYALCPRCRCADPCSVKTCPEGTRCAVTLVDQNDPTEYETVCKPIRKSGTCPPIVSNATTCEQECTSDADCIDDNKCCSNGCGTSCLEPASTKPITTTVLPPYVDVTSYPDAEPAAIEQPKDPHVKAEEGSYVTLECSCTGNPKPLITWRKGVTLIDNEMSRHSIRIDGSLQIVDLYSTDSGIYTCTADNRLAAPVRIQYELQITEPHNRISAIIGELNYHVTVTLNSPTVLRCPAVGWPRPSVNWWHGKKLLPLSDGVYEQQRDHSLRIHKVSLTNLGVYTCQANNGIGRPASWSVILQALGTLLDLTEENRLYARYLIAPSRRPTDPNTRPPHVKRPQITKAPEPWTYPPLPPTVQTRGPPIYPATDPSPVIRIPSKYTVPVSVNVSAEAGSFQIGSEFSIGCSVDGFPIPRVAWYKDDVPVQPDNRITITDLNRLKISEAQQSDSGRYRCRAANEYSSGEASVDIEVAGIYIHPDCQDNPFFAKCELIVKAKYCDHKYYARFCCRSCTEAGQLPVRGPHINETRRKRRSLISFS